MVNPISSFNTNPIQMLNALNAFKASESPEKNNISEPTDGIEINDQSILQNQNLDEIKTFAKNAGEENLSNEDIQYGLTYGRSVIADFVI